MVGSYAQIEVTKRANRILLEPLLLASIPVLERDSIAGDGTFVADGQELIAADVL